MKRRSRKAVLEGVRRALALAALIALGSCGVYPYRADRVPRRAEVPDEAYAPFDYERDTVAPETTAFEDQGSYRTREVRFPARDGERGRPAKAIEYRSERSAPGPGVVVMPILGGDYFVSTWFAEYLAARGFHCLRFVRPGRMLDRREGFEEAMAVYQRTVIDVRRGLDWWLTEECVDRARIGIVGVSQGGILSVAAMAVDKRIRAGVFLLAGGGIPELLARSAERSVVRFREAVMEREGLSEARFLEEAYRVLGACDVLVLARGIDPSRVLLIQALYDDVVPRWAQDALWEAAGRPARVLFPFGHYSAVCVLPIAAWLTRRHLEEVLTPLGGTGEIAASRAGSGAPEPAAGR